MLRIQCFALVLIEITPNACDSLFADKWRVGSFYMTKLEDLAIENAQHSRRQRIRLVGGSVTNWRLFAVCQSSEITATHNQRVVYSKLFAYNRQESHQMVGIGETAYRFA